MRTFAILAALTALATALPQPVGVTARSNNAACYAATAAGSRTLRCPNPDASVLTPRAETDTPVNMCELNGREVHCPSLLKRAELAARDASSMCMLHLETGQGVVRCADGADAVQKRGLVERAVGVMCRLAGNTPRCGNTLKAREAEAEAVPICMVDGPCEPLIGNGKFHAMSLTSDEAN